MLDPCPGRDVASLPGPIYLVPVERLLKHLTLSRWTLHHIRRTLRSNDCDLACCRLASFLSRISGCPGALRRRDPYFVK